MLFGNRKQPLFAMLAVLSPAKTMDFAPHNRGITPTDPVLGSEAARVVRTALRPLSKSKLKQLLAVSDGLAALNHERYHAFKDDPKEAEAAKPCVLAYRGPTYQGLGVDTLQDAELKVAQDHVRVFSGLYGILRPLDVIQPYRLDMGTRLAVDDCKNLYAFWGERVTAELVRAAQFLRDQYGNATILSCASEEYMKVLQRSELPSWLQVVDAVFLDQAGGSTAFRTMSVFAKRARGLLARWVVQHRPTTVAELQAFDSEGYAFHAASSSDARLVFRRTVAQREAHGPKPARKTAPRKRASPSPAAAGGPAQYGGESPDGQRSRSRRRRGTQSPRAEHGQAAVALRGPGLGSSGSSRASPPPGMSQDAAASAMDSPRDVCAVADTGVANSPRRSRRLQKGHGDRRWARETQPDGTAMDSMKRQTGQDDDFAREQRQLAAQMPPEA